MESYFDEQEIKIILADDHELVRTGIKRILQFEKNFKILGDASNGEDAIELVKYHKPDVALLDINMPKMNGIEATSIIKSNYPDTFVIIITAFEDAHHLEQAMDAGADGYLAKDIASKDLISSIKSVVEGERVFSKSILQIIQNKFLPSEVDSSPVSITKREQEILNYIAIGKTSQEIADLLHLSIRTVQSHRANMMHKLGLKTASGLIRYAVMRYKVE